MTTYAIGDIQGCYKELMQLLDKVGFNPQKDKLLLTGDLVNRGPQSLEVLRFVHNHQKCILSVLGNHDFHLLNIAYGYSKAKPQDTLSSILNAKDKVNLIEYLRHLPLFIQHNDYVLTHAGVPPIWSISETSKYADEVEKALQSDQCDNLLANLYGNQPNLWNEQLSGNSRLRCIINYLTRMRLIDQNSQLDFNYKGDLSHIPNGLKPWFLTTNSKLNTKQKILFGHWAQLAGKTNLPNIIALDYGCVWGGKLAAFALETNNFYFTDALSKH